MIEFTAIESLIMAYAPLLVTIIGIVVAFIKLLSAIKSIKTNNTLSNAEKERQIKNLIDLNETMQKDNENLRGEIHELLTKIDNVKRR